MHFDILEVAYAMYLTCLHFNSKGEGRLPTCYFRNQVADNVSQSCGNPLHTPRADERFQVGSVPKKGVLGKCHIFGLSVKVDSAIISDRLSLTLSIPPPPPF